MSPHRVSRGDSYRIDRRFPGVGRIALASRTGSEKRFRALDQMLTELFEDGYIDILRAIRDRRVTVLEVYDARRSGRLTHVASDLPLHRPLWSAVDEWIPTSAPADASRKRYESSFKALRERGPLGARARVQDLRTVEWKGLRRDWGRSGADWNRLRAAVSRFLTVSLGGDKFHPFRRDVMSRFPRAAEPRGRVPDLTPATLWKLVNAAPEHVRASLVCLAVTGLRVRSEYLRLEPHHLLPAHAEHTGARDEIGSERSDNPRGAGGVGVGSRCRALASPVQMAPNALQASCGGDWDAGAASARPSAPHVADALRSWSPRSKDPGGDATRDACHDAPIHGLARSGRGRRRHRPRPIPEREGGLALMPREPVAQVVEQETFNLQAVGSSPTRLTSTQEDAPTVGPTAVRPCPSEGSSCKPFRRWDHAF